MPNRIIKESICTSPTLDQLTPEEEVCFYRLIVKCDDFGRFDGRAEVVAGVCFPLKLGRSAVKVADVEKWLRRLSLVNLIVLYVVKDVRYLQMTTWPEHQSTRANKSKYPLSTDESICVQVNANESECSQMSPYSYSYSGTYSRTLSSSKTFDETTDPYRLSLLLKELMLRNNPKAKIPTNLQKWATEIDRAIRLDNRTPGELEQALRWSQDDEFWMTNILSAKTLREQFDKLWMRMARERAKPAPRVINEFTQ